MHQNSLFTVTELNPIPNTGWIAPKDFPRLEAAEAIAVDLETYDPHLMTHGPGWGRGDGHIVGIAVGVPTGERWYFPMRHEVGGGNLDPSMVLKWAARELGREHQPKIGANLEYDTGWLAEEGVTVRGTLIDVQYAEPLLDEHRTSYSLDSLAETHLDEHKVDDALYAWLHRAYGGSKGRAQAANIYRAPASLVGPYAEGDVDLPLRIWEKQRPMLEEQGLMELFRLECNLIPILMRMRMKGVRLDEQKLEQTIATMDGKRSDASKALRGLVGFDVDPNAPTTLVKAFDKLGLEYPTTPKGNPSFRKEFLDNHPHEIGHHIREVRRWETYANFAASYRDKVDGNGCIHGSYHPLRGEGGGTVVGRLSSSNPNLTNIPVRDPEAKTLLRGLFLPSEGCRWRSRDFSQIQFRIMTHYAMGPGAEEARQRYINYPSTDYHDMALEMTAPVAGWDIGTPEKFKAWRRPVKSINFALAFTGGLPTLMKQLGKPKAEVEQLLNDYHAAMPFLKHTSDRIDKVAQERGYIRGVLGRRHRFPFWEPKCWALRDYVTKDTNIDVVEQRIAELIINPPAKLRGKRLFAGVKRAYTHLGLNRLAQDGEGSTIKKALVECDKAGIYDVIGVPLLTVHDQVDHDDPMTPEAADAFAEMQRIMENCVRWKVPLKVDDEVGPNWAELAALEE